MNHPDIVKAFESAAEYFDSMSKEEFDAIIAECTKERCDPVTCGGSCQGMGWCYTCEDFRGEAPDDHMEELMG